MASTCPERTDRPVLIYLQVHVRRKILLVKSCHCSRSSMRVRMAPREGDGLRSPVTYHLDLSPNQTGQTVVGCGL